MDSSSMKRRLFPLFLGIGLSAAIFATPLQTHATLGEPADSIESDRNALSAVRHVAIIRKGYSIQELAADSTVVREYVSPSGVVFGIAWNGLIHPDLSHLLGLYAGDYQKALQQTPRKPGRRRLQVKTDRVVVEKWGHMRRLQGRAYAPALVPPGVSIDEIR